MKKYVTGIGLLYVALMFFSCKQPAALKLNNISQHEIIEISSSFSGKFASGLTVGDGEVLQAYAARMSSEDVSTLFGSAHFAATVATSPFEVENEAIKKKVGGAFYVGDNFNIGYRVVKKANGEIVRSKVVAVKVVSPYKDYVAKGIDALAADPMVEFVYSLGGKNTKGEDVPSAWYVKVTIAGKKLPTMTARVLIGGSKKIEDVKEAELPYTKAAVVGANTIFLCKVDVAKIEKDIPLHALVQFKDIEDESVNAKTVASLSLPKVDPAQPEYAWNMTVKTELSDKTPLITAKDAEERIVSTKDLNVTITNAAASITALYLHAETVTPMYRYQVSTAEDFAGAVWYDAEKSGNDYIAALDNLTANQLYYFRAEVTYMVTGKDNTKQYQVQKVVSPAVSFKTRDEYNAIRDFKFDYSDDSHKIKASYWDGKYTDTPAALKHEGGKSKSTSLQLDAGKKIKSHEGAMYSSGALTFQMRLPGEADLKTLLNTGYAKRFKLVDNTGKAISSYEEPGKVVLAEFETDPAVKVQLCYYAPTYKASNDGNSSAQWTLSEQGMLKLLITANGADTPAATAILATTGHKLENSTDLDNILAAAVASTVKEMVFDANAWTTWADCSITFTKEKITAQVGAASHEVTFEKPKHIDIVENGYTNFSLTSKLDGINIKNVKYVVTK